MNLFVSFVTSSVVNLFSGVLGVAGALVVFDAVVVPIATIAQNTNGIVLLSFYTQVIQAGMNGNLAQSLVLASPIAPNGFSSKANCFPIYRTFQSDKQSPIALGGFAPVNIMSVHILPGWGIWQVLTVVNSALDRNNMRLGIVFLS